MTDPERSNETGNADAEAYDEDEPRNPFDNPYFLPILMGGFALYCGWDGFISDKFLERPGTLWFNRIAFLLFGAGAAWLFAKARREPRHDEHPPE